MFYTNFRLISGVQELAGSQQPAGGVADAGTGGLLRRPALLLKFRAGATNSRKFYNNYIYSTKSHQVWCGHTRPEALRSKLKTAVHAPGPYR